jgi:hypothetical protein
MTRLTVIYIVAGVLAFLAVRRFMRKLESAPKRVPPSAYGVLQV